MPDNTIESSDTQQSSRWLQRLLGEDKQRRNDHRSPFQRDRARILHSAAFRRLQAKTQVLGVGTGITAQLRRKYPELRYLLNSMSLIESICLAHDIGHPPFGHGGEVALNYMMRHHGGFEGNGQTFRILTRLEPYTPSWGMNLTRRTLLGVMKYPATHGQLFVDQQRPDIINHRQLKPSEWPPVKGLFNDDKPIIDWVLAQAIIYQQ